MTQANWPVALKPLLKLYKGKPHPLDFRNNYELLVVVLLAARDSDQHINQLAPSFFSNFKSMQQLSTASIAEITMAIKGVTNYHNKAKWLSAISKQLPDDKAIPLKMDALEALPGIGRKSANVILREAGATASGIVVDLHTIRVATRLGISKATKAAAIEEELMAILPPRQWEAGMAMSFLGREICRPRPCCNKCIMKAACAHYQQLPIT